MTCYESDQNVLDVSVSFKRLKIKHCGTSYNEVKYIKGR